VVVLNEPARRVLDTFTAPRPLRGVTDRQLAELGLLATNTMAESVAHDASSTLTAWLHLTDACNLSCSYCYVRKSDRSMDEPVGRAAVDVVIRSALTHGFRAVKLKYAGGEPTLSWPLVRSLHARARALAAQHNLELRAALLSNGTLLTDEMIAWLRDENVRLMISLDGVGAAHDAQRPFPNGSGSFALVSQSVDRALVRGLSPHLSITVTARNAESLAETVAFALERDLLFNFNFVRQPGAEIDHTRLIAGMQAAFAVIETARPRRRLIDGLLDRSGFGVPHRYPCGAGRSYLVIDPLGRVARCQMTTDEPLVDVWDDDPLRMIQESSDGFQNVSVDENEDCRECVWRYWCAGGCPLLAYRTVGRSDRSSLYCPVYRMLFPALLRLEGLRLLRWALSA
jgi:uncharacterized protein